MKRKLNEHDVPEAVLPEEVEEDDSAAPTSFDRFAIDARLLQAIAAEKYAVPTPVQAKAIPLALDGRDILARAKTGSGKTAAYILPILQSILRRKASTKATRNCTAIILVPTKELASQVTRSVAALSAFCAKDVHAVNLTPQISDAAQRALLATVPDIVISTPSRIAQHLSNSNLAVEDLAHLVVDEADLVLSYGYEEDFKTIVNLIPRGVQTFLASATLTTEVDTLKGLFCRDPVVLDLQEDSKDTSSVSQYAVKCAEDEKFLLIFALFKLKLVKGKCIVFVGDVDRCYRVKLFLEQFGIKSCVLNSELPVNCRIHVVEEFNKNVYDVIIATDEHEVIGDEEMSYDDAEAGEKAPSETVQTGDETGQEKSDNGGTTEQPRKKKRRSTKKDREYGVSRGIDFRNVACVLNFDLPSNPRSYTHRIGRTARAGRTGIALSFVIPSTLYRKHKPTSFQGTEHDEVVLAKIVRSEEKRGHQVNPYHFDMAKLEGFRYRVSSALKAVSPGAIREARIRELRQELLKSEKLKRHLEENPADLQYLRHDTDLRPAKILSHMKHVPDYLMPGGEGGQNGGMANVGFVGIGKQTDNRIRQARARNKLRGRSGGKRVTTKKSDPLKTFNAKGRGK